MTTSSNKAQSYVSYKIFFFGDTRVGKTSFIFRMSEGTFEENLVATIGCDSKQKKMPLENGQMATIEMWDTAGQERFKSITRNLIKKADGVLLLYAINDRTSFENVSQWIVDIKSMGQSNLPIVLVGNKNDLINERVVSIEEGKMIAEKNGILFFEGSCKEDTNIATIFRKTVKSIYDSKELSKQQSSEGRISITRKDQEASKKKCC